MTAALRRENAELFRDPLGYARAVEALCADQYNPPSPRDPELAYRLCRAVYGRFITQSGFTSFDSLIEFVEREWLQAPEVFNNLDPLLRDEIQVALFGMRMIRTPSHPSIDELAQRCERIAHTHGYTPVRMAAGAYLVAHFAWRGAMDRCVEVLDGLAPTRELTTDPVVRMMGFALEAFALRMLGDGQRLRLRVAEALASATSVEGAAWDSFLRLQQVMGQLNQRDLAGAAAGLDRLLDDLDESRTLEAGLILYARSWYAAQRGAKAEALAAMRRAHPLLVSSGSWFHQRLSHLVLTQRWLAVGRLLPAYFHLLRLRSSGLGHYSAYAIFLRRLTQACFWQQAGIRRLALRPLREALRLGRRNQFLYLPALPDTLLAALLELAEHAGIESDYVQILRHQRPPAGPGPIPDQLAL